LSRQNPREIAAQILQHRRGSDEFIENLLERASARAQLSSADRGLCQELVYGVVRWQATLDWLITCKTGGRAQKPGLHDLLRLGLYQIFFLDRIPDHAAVHETVEIAKRRGFGPQAGFLNAVLRGYLREHDQTQKLLTDLKLSQPASGWSHPEWLVARWQKRWGDERTRQLLEWNNTPPKTFARINTLRADPGKLLSQWRDENVEYDFVRRDWFEENLVFELKSHPPLAALPSFQQGRFYVQDPSTLLAVRELDPQPGEAILDFCAAPGGKTTFIAQTMNNQGRIVAHDRSVDGVKLIRENGARLGVTNVEAVSTCAFQPSTFDRVLVDAPCSNTGVMRRRVDLCWRITPEEIQRLQAIQLNLLQQAAKAVKPSGVLVYSTCSLEPEENAGVVKDFLNENKAFKRERERELLPFVDGVDGAFVARIRRAPA
jgi:16S rRNA (cytosine967-C5)-methyltransferase